jgi:hypothetical protein
MPPCAHLSRCLNDTSCVDNHKLAKTTQCLPPLLTPGSSYTLAAAPGRPRSKAMPQLMHAANSVAMRLIGHDLYWRFPPSPGADASHQIWAMRVWLERCACKDVRDQLKALLIERTTAWGGRQSPSLPLGVCLAEVPMSALCSWLLHALKSKRLSERSIFYKTWQWHTGILRKTWMESASVPYTFLKD